MTPFRNPFRTLTLKAAVLCVAVLAVLPLSVRAGIVYQLAQPSITPGQAIELQGILFNDTQDALTVTPPATLDTGLDDAQGGSQPLQFTLSSPPDVIILPANTFARITWTAIAPPTAQGLQRLRVAGQPQAALALNITGTDGGPAPMTALAQAPQGSNTGTGIGAGTATDQSLAATSAPSGQADLSPFDQFRNGISPYEPVYFIVGNRDGTDARFQLSFKYRFLSPPDPADAGFMNHFYFGYTQTSLWDLHSDSIPFIDSTYNPSLFWNRDVLWESAARDWSIGLNAGVEHKSNGKSDDESRSLNDLYVQPSFDYRFDGGSVLSFMPRFKYYVQTDRDMRYPDYLGRVDWKLRWAQDNGLSLAALYRQGSEGRNAIQLEAAWPLRRTFLHMNGYLYAQYFRGYGETLLGYQEKSSPVVRFGIALVP